MRLSKQYLRSFLAVVVITIMVNPAAAAPVDAYAGYVSDNRVHEGDKVVFSGTFHNFLNQEVYVASFNVSFVEILGPAATRDPAKPNISRYLEGERRVVSANGSYTDSLTGDIDFDPGAYNVSIFFAYSNNSNVNAATQLTNVYALANASFAVQGVTEAIEIFRVVGIVISVLIVGAIGLLIYNAKFKKSY